MDETGLDDTSSRPPIVDSYHSKTRDDFFSRPVSSCEKSWRLDELEMKSFDGLVVTQLERAREAGRSDVVVVDIGSGDANLFRSYINNGESSKETRAFLEEHPEMKIEFVGLTDAKEADEFLDQDEIEVSEDAPLPNEDSVRIRNVKYTLTYNQTLAKFLNELGVEDVDLFVSTQCLTYLAPNVFRQVVEDCITRLQDGGRLVASGYHNVNIPGYISDGFVTKLDIRDFDRNETSLKSTLTEGPMRFARSNVDPAEEERMLEKAEDLLCERGYITREKLEKIKAEHMNPDKVKEYGRSTCLAWRSGSTVWQIVKKMHGKKVAALGERKKQALEKLSDEYSDEVSIKYGDVTLVVAK